MLYKIAACVATWILLCGHVTSNAQSADPGDHGGLAVPSGLFRKIQQKTGDLDRRLTRQTEKYLQRMSRQEEKLRKKVSKLDSTGAKQLFANSSSRYVALMQQLRTDTGSKAMTIRGEYQPYTDSLSGTLAFLQQNPTVLDGAGASTAVEGAASQLQALQAKLQDADQIKQYIRDRKAQINQYISQHADWQGVLGKPFQAMSKDAYYYSQQVREYKEALNNPDQLEQKALAALNQLPAFQSFMKEHSQLAGLFNLPGNYGSSQALAGLQTRDLVGQLIQNQVAAGGAGGAAALQSNLQAAQSQLDTYKDKLSQLGAGSGDIDMPNFKPNDQKTKTFWKRIELGANFQTSRRNYLFPTTSDIGLSVGYRLGRSNVIGVGAAYKLGWGNGINHIAFSSQGVGLRSFVDIKLKGSFFVSGGLEFNYERPFASVQQLRFPDLWTKSGLIGVSKTVSMKSRLFKKTKLSLLWDFLSYQQVPKTQAILFRIGYAF